MLFLSTKVDYYFIWYTYLFSSIRDLSCLFHDIVSECVNFNVSSVWFEIIMKRRHITTFI